MSYRSASVINSMIENKPCIVKCDISAWKINDLFLNESRMFCPDVFCNLYGDEVICVHNDSTDKENPKLNIRINEFISRIKNGEKLYAKDWHLFQFNKNLDLYRTPIEFQDDWLNWYWKRCKRGKDDYRFVYLGGKDTVTYVHHDVLYSYSWSINLYGTKKWTLFPTKDTKNLLKVNTADEYITDVREGRYDPDMFPGMKHTNPVEIIQEVGEAIFVPAGWYHMVENMGPLCPNNAKQTPLYANVTLSLNHNWINGFNIRESWRFLLRELHSVRREMWDFLEPSARGVVKSHSEAIGRSHIGSDFLFDRGGIDMSLQEWNKHCDLTLRVNSGLNFADFFEMVFSRVLCLCVVHREATGEMHSDLSIINSQCDDEIQYISVEKFRPIITEQICVDSQDKEVYGKLISDMIPSCPNGFRKEHHPVDGTNVCDKGGLYDSKNSTISNPSSIASSIVYPLSTFHFCMLEILYILDDLASLNPHVNLLEYMESIYEIPSEELEEIIRSFSDIVMKTFPNIS